MNKPFSELIEKFQQALDPPLVGASAIFSSLYTKQSNLNLANRIFSGLPWLSVCTVILITWLAVRSNLVLNINQLRTLLALYILYNLLLEITSRWFKQQHESAWFRACRVVINYGFVTALVGMYAGVGNYFWFFYSLPILQAIIYFNYRGVVLVSTGSIITYWIVFIIATQRLHLAPDYALATMSSLILCLLSFILYWLFRSAQENKAESRELLERTQKSLVLLQTLNQITGQFNSTSSIPAILQTALIEGLRAIQTDQGSIMLVDPLIGEVKLEARIAKGGYTLYKTPRKLTVDEEITGHVISTGIFYNCPDTVKDELCVSTRAVRQPGSLLCVPITSEGPVVGVINADSTLSHFFETEDIEFLSAMAGNLAVAIEKIKLFDAVTAQHNQAQRMAATLLGLQTATTEMQSELELARLLNVISMQAAKLLNADSSCILLLDKTKQILTIRGAYELSEKTIHGTRDRVGHSIAGRVIKQQAPIIAHEVATHPWFYNPAALEEKWLAIVSTPMWIDGQIIGTLDIHSRTTKEAFTEKDLEILSLMARQAEVAIAKAQQFEQDQRRIQASNLVQRILEKTDQSEQAGRLDSLLLAMQREVKQLLPEVDLTVVLKNTSGHWSYNFLRHILGGAYNPRWLRPADDSLIVHVAAHKEPLLLSTGTAIYCHQYNLSPTNPESAQSWLGLPMIVGDLTVGAIAMQDDEQQYALGEAAYELCQTIVRHLSGAIYSAWVDEQRAELYQQLTMLQRASETIMLLAKQNEDWLWHATLTLATAHYGLRFERAVLFLSEHEGRHVSGRMGIGNFDRTLAFHDWSKDELGDMTWERYLQALQAGELTPTEIEHFVRDWQIDFTEGSTFASVLRSGEIRQVKASEAKARLPKAFVEKFGICDYSLVPIKAGQRELGLVVLSNPIRGELHRRESLVYFATLVNQAALIYENLQQHNRLTQFIGIDHKVLVSANKQLLQQTLCEICQAAKELTSADFVMLYPLKADHPTHEYDLVNVGYTGGDAQLLVSKNRYPSSFTRHIMETETIYIPDTELEVAIHGGVRAVDHDFIQNAGIRALIAVPIRGPVTHKLRGILFINFRTPRNFTEQEKQLAELFARLGNLAIRQAHEFTNLRSDKQAKEEEIQLLSGMLQKALVYEIKESELIKTMLDKTQRLLAMPDVHFAISLLEWQPSEDTYTEPRQIRRTYYLTPENDQRDKLYTENVYFGISGKALQTGITQFAENVSTGDWPTIFYDLGIGTRAEIDVPIITPAEQTIGVLTVEAPQLDTLTDVHVAMLDRLAAVLGLALDHARRQRNLRTLLDAAAMMTTPTTLEETLQAVLDAARQVSPDLSVLTIWHESPVNGELVLGKYFGIHHEAELRHEKPRDDGLVNSVMKARKAIWAENFAGRGLFTGSNFVQREDLQSSVVFPLLAGDQQIGVMFFSYRRLHKFAAEEHLLFPILAQIAAASIHDALLLDEADKEHKRLRMALDILETVSGELSVEQTLTNILKRLTADDLFPNISACILLYNKTEHVLEFSPASYNFYRIDNPSCINLTHVALDTSTIAGGLAHKSIELKAGIYLNIGDVYIDPSYKPARLDTQSQLTVTLYSERQGLHGVLVLESDEPDAFDADAEQMALGIARQVTVALERAHLVTSVRRKDVLSSAAFWALDVAHYINSETGLIRNWANFLATEIGLSADGKEYVKEIQLSSAKLASVMSNISSKWGVAEAMDSRNVEDALQGYIEDIQAERDVALEICFSPYAGNVRVRAELLSLGKIVRYIVQNALEAMQVSPNQRLVIRTIITNQWFEIYVEDNGPGIADPKIRQSILNEPVVSTKGEGHGYGLLFASDAVERSGGLIRLLPYVPGKGATFVVSLPMVVD